MYSERTIRGYKALAAYLGIGIESARRLMKREDFPTLEITPRVRIILVNALEEWLKMQSNKA